jgi:hypothetical protein
MNRRLSREGQAACGATNDGRRTFTKITNGSERTNIHCHWGRSERAFPADTCGNRRPVGHEPRPAATSRGAARHIEGICLSYRILQFPIPSHARDGRSPNSRAYTSETCKGLAPFHHAVVSFKGWELRATRSSGALRPLDANHSLTSDGERSADARRRHMFGTHRHPEETGADCECMPGGHGRKS